MPRFYFHFDDGGKTEFDEDGLEFPSTEDAYIGAFDAVRDLWSSMLHEQKDPTHCAFEIADGAHRLLHRLEFTEVLETYGRNAWPAKPQHNLMLAAALEEIHRRAATATEELQLGMSAFRQTLADTRTLLKELNRRAPAAPPPREPPQQGE